MDTKIISSSLFLASTFCSSFRYNDTKSFVKSVKSMLFSTAGNRQEETQNSTTNPIFFMIQMFECATSEGAVQPQDMV